MKELSKKEKQELSEIDICDNFITPAIKDAQTTQNQLADAIVEQAVA